VSIGHRVRVSDAEIQREIVKGPEHEISHWIARTRSSKSEERWTKKDLAEIKIQQFVPELETVPTLDPVHAILECQLVFQKPVVDPVPPRMKLSATLTQTTPVEYWGMSMSQVESEQW
jgi:hypothetical protein